jgi:hypothetical protein
MSNFDCLPGKAGGSPFVLVKLDVRERDVARLETRNAYLASGLKLQGRHFTNTLKEVVTLRQQLAKRRSRG